jgi:hypothetical protein
MKGASASVVMHIEVPRDAFFWWFLAVDLSRIMHRYAILPAVVATTDQTGPMHQPGSRRVVRFTDGTSAVEEVTSCDPPSVIDYRIRDLTSGFRHLVSHGLATIHFGDSASRGVLVHWRYTYIGRNLPATLLLQLLVPTIWRGFMLSSLRRAKIIAEVEAARPPR